MSKILIIDDDPVTQTFCKRIFEKEGIDVETASDGYEGLSKAVTGHYNVMLIDLVLPGGITGVDIIKKIRTTSKNVKIVAYSGFSDKDIEEKVKHAGANNFITKPFKPDDLLTTIFPNKVANKNKIPAPTKQKTNIKIPEVASDFIKDTPKVRELNNENSDYAFSMATDLD